MSFEFDDVTKPDQCLDFDNDQLRIRGDECPVKPLVYFGQFVVGETPDVGDRGISRNRHPI